MVGRLVVCVLGEIWACVACCAGLLWLSHSFSLMRFAPSFSFIFRERLVDYHPGAKATAGEREVWPREEVEVEC